MDNPKPIGKGLGEYLDGQRKQIEGLQIQLKEVREEKRLSFEASSERFLRAEAIADKANQRADGYLKALKEILAGTHDNDQEVKEGHFCAGCIAREAIKAGESK